MTTKSSGIFTDVVNSFVVLGSEADDKVVVSRISPKFDDDTDTVVANTVDLAGQDVGAGWDC